MQSFETFNLPKSIKKSLDEQGIIVPTPIQQKTYKKILSGKDVMGIAQTGTGKTLAYLLPVLKMFDFKISESPQILIIVPTRELVIQVHDEIEKLTKYTAITSAGIFGGVNINTQKKAVCDGINIIVGTPGRVLDLALDGILRFDEVKRLIIDEFDEMMNLGFRVQLISILALLKPKRQNILFSATMTDEVNDVLEDFFDFPEEITLAKSGTPLEKIEQKKYFLPNFNTKTNLLLSLLEDTENVSRVLIFVNNKRIADILHERIETNFLEQFGVIHSNKSQNYRLSTIRDFQNGVTRGIITTDVMARGLDISDITHVINFDIPESPEQYIHRIGRTGRKDKSGTAISFVTPREEDIFIEIEILMDKELEIIEIPDDIEISTELIEAEKIKNKVKFLLKKPKISENGAFHEKKDKNKKVNLGGPGKRTPRKTKPKNRGTNKSKK